MFTPAIRATCFSMLHRVQAKTALPYLIAVYRDVQNARANRLQRPKARLAHTIGCRPPDQVRTCRMDARLTRFTRYVNCQEIGRASCRARVCQYVKITVVAVSFKTNNKP